MVKKLFKTLFLHSFKRTFFIVGGLIVMLSLPITILLVGQKQDVRQRASENCTMSFVGGRYLCVSNTGSGTGVYGLPPGTSTTVNGTVYYGNPEGGIAVTEKPPEIIVPDLSQITIPPPTASITPPASAATSSTTCKQKCSIEGEKAASDDLNYYYICKSGCFDNYEKCPAGTTFDKVALNCLDPNRSELAKLIDVGNRDGVRAWAASRSISEINNSVSSLTPGYKNALAETVLNSGASGADRSNLLAAMQKVLNNPSTGFYAEIWSYTVLELPKSGGGGEATCGIARLFEKGGTAQSMLDVLMHESLHSFNCMNGGPQGALDEGSSIWVFKAAFPGGRSADIMRGGLAEATFGTVNYYRDLGTSGINYSPLNAGPGTTSKSREFFDWLSSTDPSKLPWNDITKLRACYNLYYQSLNRNVSEEKWFSVAAAASQKIAADPNCTGTAGGLSAETQAIVGSSQGAPGNGDIACSSTTPCPSQINCSVGCLSVSLTCVNGLCRVPNSQPCAATLAMTNGGCMTNNYCTRNASNSTFTCQPKRPDGTSCTDLSECQPSSERTCSATQCRPAGSPLQAACCPTGKFWCPSTNSCTGQGDGSCPCAITPTPTDTPTLNPCLTTSNRPANCSCTANSQCETEFCDLEGTKTCKQFTPSSTPTNTPTPTTQLGLTCDPVKDGNIDELDFQWLKDEMLGNKTTIIADCFKPDGFVNALDFQVWKDINFDKRPAF